MTYVIYVLLLLLGRSIDLYSTYCFTPDLKMEFSAVVKRLGWKGTLVFNIIVVFALPYLYPIGAEMLATISFLAGIHNARLTQAKALVGANRNIAIETERSDRSLPFMRSFAPIAIDLISHVALGCLIWWVAKYPPIGLTFILFGAYLFYSQTIHLLANWGENLKEGNEVNE